MQKITIKELVDFRRKTTESGRKSFAHKLKTRRGKEKSEEDENSGGGDYWVTSTSCIYNVFKHDKSDFYENKIAELATKLGAADDKRIKSMHQRNIDILNNFKDFHMV